jgi:hypothetical protein
MIDNVLLSRKLSLLSKSTASAGGFELAACSCPEDHIRQGRVAVGKSITLDSIDRVILFSFAGILQVGKRFTWPVISDCDLPDCLGVWGHFYLTNLTGFM